MAFHERAEKTVKSKQDGAVSYKLWRTTRRLDAGDVPEPCTDGVAVGDLLASGNSSWTRPLAASQWMLVEKGSAHPCHRDIVLGSAGLWVQAKSAMRQEQREVGNDSGASMHEIAADLSHTSQVKHHRSQTPVIPEDVAPMDVDESTGGEGNEVGFANGIEEGDY